jgi:hypothetical protein
LFLFSGKVQKLSYFLFMDAQCTKAIKRVVHSIYSEVPNYSMCVPSRTTPKDKRATLTVCHNDGGDDAMPPPPMAV